MDAAFETVELSLWDWEKMSEAFKDQTVFQTGAWLSFLKKMQQAKPVLAALRSGGMVLGYFSGLIIKKFGVKILGSPFPGWTTCYIGMNLLPDVSRRHALEALIRWAFEDLGCVHLELMNRISQSTT